jgi:hypothetical protein
MTNNEVGDYLETIRHSSLASLNSIFVSLSPLFSLIGQQPYQRQSVTNRRSIQLSIKEILQLRTTLLKVHPS